MNETQSLHHKCTDNNAETVFVLVSAAEAAVASNEILKPGLSLIICEK